jgi:hypothetical protein
VVRFFWFVLTALYSRFLASFLILQASRVHENYKGPSDLQEALFRRDAIPQH